jgi:predicted nucleic acid-binding protein
VVVDSSGWIEVFTDGPRADVFLEVLEVEERLVVPSITIFEVFKWILREHSEADAIQASAVMQRGLVVQLDPTTAVAAAQLSHVLRLPMADSVILTTARQHQARLYSMDADFQGLSDVELVLKAT